MSNSTAVTLTSTGNNSNHSPCYAAKEFGVPRAVDLYVNISVVIILIVSVIGNILVIRGTRLSHPRPVSYLLIANIAIAELILAFNSPFTVHYYTRPWDWVFGKLMCKVNSPVSVCCTMVISFTLAALSVYRCCILTRPSVRLSKIRLNVHVVVVVSWLWGLSTAIPMIPEGKVITYPLCAGGVTRSCSYKPESQSMDMYVNTVQFIGHYMVPLLVITFSYGIVVILVKKHIRRTSRNEDIEMTDNVTDQTNDDNGEEESASANSERRQSCKIIQMESRLLKMIYVIILIYIICYTPENLVYLIWRSQHKIFDNPNDTFLFHRHTIILHALSMALHPICYGWMSGIIQRNFNCVITVSKT